MSKTYDGLTQMLLTNRIDYIIEYAIIVNFRSKKLKIKNNTKSLDIEDISSVKYLPVYTACLKSEWGTKVIKEIDEILIKESENSDFLGSRIKWYSKSDQKKLIKLYNKHYFKDK